MIIRILRVLLAILAFIPCIVVASIGALFSFYAVAIAGLMIYVATGRWPQEMRPLDAFGKAYELAFVPFRIGGMDDA